MDVDGVATPALSTTSIATAAASTSFSLGRLPAKSQPASELLGSEKSVLRQSDAWHSSEIIPKPNPPLRSSSPQSLDDCDTRIHEVNASEENSKEKAEVKRKEQDTKKTFEPGKTMNFSLTDSVGSITINDNLHPKVKRLHIVSPSGDGSTAVVEPNDSPGASGAGRINKGGLSGCQTVLPTGQPGSMAMLAFSFEASGAQFSQSNRLPRKGLHNTASANSIKGRPRKEAGRLCIRDRKKEGRPSQMV
ncbi:unnamed protein product [Protopolystoma xenopodis]|uniref:Uncharacterized protein n=1 Tax=Protopolystoma xenopodis TaxID=117903 RepID=A0A3S5FCU0_9PLAT|nr:unnamed protein product [Protopolystoma xenopodis]